MITSKLENMKKRLTCFLITCVVLLCFPSCKKVLASIYGGSDVPIPQSELIIPQVYIVPTDELYLGSFVYDINLDSSVRANTRGVFGASSVNSVKVKSVIIKIINPDAYDNLSNFDSARVTLQSSTNNTPIQLFNIGLPSTYSDSLYYIPTNNPELLSYVKGNTITCNVYGKMRTVTNKPLGITVDVTLRAN
jgi:hypothetical protein